MLLSLFVVGVSGAWLPPGALRVSPESYTVLRTSGNSTLHQINLPANATYAAGAWEDATPNRSKWRPAACNAYVRIDFDRFW